MSSNRSFWRDTLGRAWDPACEEGGPDWVVAADATDPCSSSLSVSPKDKGGGMAGASSKKSQGSSSVLLWFTPK